MSNVKEMAATSSRKTHAPSEMSCEPENGSSTAINNSVCVECGQKTQGSRELYHRYSSSVLALTKCVGLSCLVRLHFLDYVYSLHLFRDKVQNTKHNELVTEVVVHFVSD